MILYYDEFFKLKEIINDKELYQGNNNVDSIYVYVENHEDLYGNASIQYELYGDSFNPEYSKTYLNDGFIDNFEIPFSKKRDLKYFNYGRTYRVIEFKIPNGDNGSENILENSGLVKATIRLTTETSVQSLSMFTFNVNEGVVSNSKNITESQFDYLLKILEKPKIYLHTLYGKNYDDYHTIYVVSTDSTPLNPETWNGGLPKPMIFIGAKTVMNNSGEILPVGITKQSSNKWIFNTIQRNNLTNYTIGIMEMDTLISDTVVEL